MAIEDALRRFLRELGIGPSRILVAASGGADSTALLLACSELRSDGFTITAGHVNHGLRGLDSDQDEDFVREICQGLDLELHVRKGNLPADEVRKRGIEAAARTVRYGALGSIRRETQSAFIATAHTRRDQAETVLMRFLTGSGTTRLQGISPATAAGILRPLLEVDRVDVLDFLAARKIVHREDRSNDDERFLRNRIRRDIMPRLLEINPKLVSTLCETASQARSEAAALGELVVRSSAGWVREDLNHTKFDLEHAPADPWLLQAVLSRQIRRLEPGLRDVSARDLKRLIQDFPSLRRVSVSGSLELFREGTIVTLRHRGSHAPGFEHVVEPE